MSKTKSVVSQGTKKEIFSLQIAPGRILKGEDCLKNAGAEIARWGKRPMVVGGDNTLKMVDGYLEGFFKEYGLKPCYDSYAPDCCETSLARLEKGLKSHGADFVIGVGGGKALDMAKLLAFKAGLPVVTIPTSGATCAAWSALSNIYSEEGAFLYDVSLRSCPDLLILDYGLIASAPSHTLIAGVGDAIAKWYEASISSGNSSATLTIAAVQQARVLRDILFQKTESAVAHPLREDWKEVVDATVLLAGVSGGLGGANCRTVAAHAVHNALTHLSSSHHNLHGAKVSYGILVQLRLEEMLDNNKLAATSRQQLIKFYKTLGLPCTLEDLGLGKITLEELRRCAQIACQPESDIHRLPFTVKPESLMAAMVSTTFV
ncbi:iron-containing alcohol dehydrogenase family protein [Cyanobacterium stanieri LEGE 03274]|uniref:Iron-containing alcohol dehydrogenase family protein n=1 Tax=Cyanobacterium stanieri LEGE 03274 TaxID=1828756 RepID=A0ABR9V8Q4_9CHRO|nr:iron-containing alcohol dehydrogenase family protein [Cyanobacterium stanieri]MBE9223521.1 iron-containing alcohol dehydrogenase family protein [Cyanobacterium stanieri LEGE 03274]